jgi:hypothetical protein
MSIDRRTTGCDANKRACDVATAAVLGLALCRAPLTANVELHGRRQGAGAGAMKRAAPPQEAPGDDAVVAAAPDDEAGYDPPRPRGLW